MSLDLAFLVGFLAAGIRLAAPIALAALGETLAQRSGVINVGLEGVMLVGAFVAVLCAVAGGSPWFGLLAAIAAGCAMGAIHAWLAVVLRLDQIVVGIALIFLGLGLSGYGYRLTLGAEGAAARVPGFEPLAIPVLSDLPVVGPLLFSQHLLVYVAVLIALALAWLFRRTRLGLVIDTAGEAPGAALALGIGVDRVRLGAVIAGGGLAGMGGAFLSIAQLSGFVEDMVAGRGFIAIACVVLARWNPLAVLLVALVFGLADAAQIRLQAFFPAIPYQLFVIAPYVVAIVSMVFFSRRSRMPAALGRAPGEAD